MKKTIILSAAICFFASCSEKNDITSDRIEAHFNAGIKSRVVDASWNQNDAIGVYMKKKDSKLNDNSILEGVQNKQYSTPDADGKFTLSSGEIPCFFPLDGSSVDFIAYYPYKKNIEDFKVPLNVEDQSSQSAIDVMYSNNAMNINSTNPNVSFTFVHKLTKLLVNIVPGDGIKASDLTDSSIYITSQKTTGYLSLVDGTISATGSNSKINFLMNNEGSQGEAIILPSEATGGRKLVIKTLDETFSWDIPYETEFGGSKKFIYNIKINKTGIDVSSSINDWDKGNNNGDAGIATTPLLNYKSSYTKDDFCSWDKSICNGCASYDDILKYLSAVNEDGNPDLYWDKTGNSFTLDGQGTAQVKGLWLRKIDKITNTGTVEENSVIPSQVSSENADKIRNSGDYFFLPAIGSYNDDGTYNINELGKNGTYWSCTAFSESSAFYLTFASGRAALSRGSLTSKYVKLMAE